MRWPFVSRPERIRREASDWIVRLNGVHSERDRAAFERWRSASPDHAAAYERISALFRAAGQVCPQRIRPDPTASVARERAWPLPYAVAAAAVAVLLAGFFLLSLGLGLPASSHETHFAVFAADPARPTRLVLADGSEISLSPASELEVAIGKTERRLRLVRGEGRFSVFHDPRPFIVAANGTEVTALGTRFVVLLADAGTIVSLIEGQVDVSYPAQRSAPSRQVRRLQAGQQIVVPRPAGPVSATSAIQSEAGLRSIMLRFDDTKLADAVAQINRNGRPPIRLSDPALGALRVTGAFRSSDTLGFARSIAAIFDLKAEQQADGSISLKSAR